MRYELYFKNIYDGRQTLIGSYLSDKEARAVMVKEIKSKGFAPYYYRMWEQEENETMVDFGSHSCFYIIKRVN